MEEENKQAEELDSIVESWFVDVFHNQPFSTEQFNRFQAAKEVLKSRIHAAVKEQSDA